MAGVIKTGANKASKNLNAGLLAKYLQEGKLSPEEMAQYEANALSMETPNLQKYNVEIQGNLIQELIDTCSSVKGMSLTLDVGIDNTRPNKPFGTPWSFEEVRKYMLPKTVLWNSRQQLS